MAEAGGRKDVNVVVLGRDNYTRWRIEVETALRGQGLYWHASGAEPQAKEPAALAAGADAAAKTAHDAKVKAFRDWDEKDSKARSIIMRTLDDVTFSHVADCTSSKAILDRIAELRDPKTTDVLMTGITAFFAETWDDEDDVSSFMSRLAVHAGRVNGCKSDTVTIADQFVMAKTLTSLPAAYGHFVQSWHLIAKSDTTLSDFREKVLAAERSMVVQLTAAGSSGEALQVTRYAQRDRRQAQGMARAGKANKANTECHYCRKRGHWKSECPKRIEDEKKEETDGTACAAAGINVALSAYYVSSSTSIIADSGASRHLTGNRSWFKTLRRLDEPLTFLAADGEIVARHVGDIEVETSVDGNKWKRRTWQDVLYIPSLTASLYSTTCRESNGFGFQHAAGRMLITKDDKPLIGGVRNGPSYKPYMRVVEPKGTSLSVQTIEVWHKRLGHVSVDMIRSMSTTGCVDGLDVVESKAMPCDGCHFGKQPANSHPSRKEFRECLPGQRMHTDVCHATIRSLAGNTMFVTVKDEASGHRMVRFLKSTAGVADALKSMLMEAERQTGRKPLSMRTDNGTEYVNGEVEKLFADAGVEHERSPPYVKQANGIAERENRILCDTARSMLFGADLTRAERNLLWAEAVNTAAYIRNRVPNSRTGKDVTPHELWCGSKPNVSHLREFGTAAYVHIPNCKRKKFDAKSRKCMLVGYDWLTTKVCRVFDREKQIVECVSDVKVEESDTDCRDVFVRRELSEGVTRTTIRMPEEDDVVRQKGDDDIRKPDEDEEPENDRNDDDIFLDAASEQDVPVLPDPLVTTALNRGPGRPPGSRNKPKPSTVIHPMSTRNKSTIRHAMSVALDPTSVADVEHREDKDEWRKAMDDEMESLRQNETWDLVCLPRSRHVVSSKWVFKSKTNPDGSLNRRKARLVARGFSQTEGVDYFETFAPVVRYESVRCVLSLAAAHDMEIRQFDVKTAFLNGKLDESVFMQQPEGYDDGSGRVCKLNRSLYGLKQSPRNWNARFIEFLGQEDFVATPEDTCVFVRHRDNDLMIVCLYVDDGLVCGSDTSAVSFFIQKLREAFDVTVNDPDCYVGMEINRNRDEKTITISQRGYIARVIERFGLTDATSVVSPIEPSVKLVVDSKDVITCPYREAIGCLNYVSQITRPDITYAVNTLARFCTSPKTVHWQAVKRVIRFLKGTIDVSITYGRSEEALVGYCDSDWGGDELERRSTSGYVFTLHGGPIAWTSRLQKTTALSVTEAEYMSLAEALTECLWLRPFLASLGQESIGATPIKVDNQAAIALSKNPEFHKRTKHVGIRYHRIRQEQENKVVTVEYVATKSNPADIFTKGVSSETLTRCLRLLNVFNSDDRNEREEVLK